jgi:phage baseplate assembly protein gpV
MIEININGTQIKCSAGNISISNGKIIVDGKTITCPIKDHTIIINGDCNDLNISGNLTVNGNIKGNVDVQGNINCRDVGGNIDAQGNVTVKK